MNVFDARIILCVSPLLLLFFANFLFNGCSSLNLCVYFDDIIACLLIDDASLISSSEISAILLIDFSCSKVWFFPNQASTLIQVLFLLLCKQGQWSESSFVVYVKAGLFHPCFWLSLGSSCGLLWYLTGFWTRNFEAREGKWWWVSHWDRVPVILNVKRFIYSDTFLIPLWAHLSFWVCF